MSLNINNSPDINFLSVVVTWDLSGVAPVVLLQNLSQGPNLANIEYAFTAISPTTTYIHEGNINDPDVVGVWSNITESWSFPRPFNQIEWGNYQFFVVVKDSEGNIYQAPTQSANICRPNGNLPDSTNTYGLGSVLVQTKCDQARIYFQDNTNTSYKGLTGTVGSSVLRVNFPMDNTGVVPTPFQINYFTSAMVPITYSGKGYQFLYTSIYDYELTPETHVRIKYVLNDTFGVWCNINLMPLICEYQKLIDSIEAGTCKDVESANRKLLLINPKFSLVMIGIMQPLTGVDVPALIKEIEEIGGFDCDCCNAASGIVPPGSSAFDGYTFSVVPLGGDIEGQFVANGFNIQLQLSDVSYVFRMCDQSPSQTTAFTVFNNTSGDGYTKTYCLNVDMVQLSTDILNTIKSDAALVNLFNSIVYPNGGNFTLIVNGNCIFSSSSTYSYAFSLSDIQANTTFSYLTAITINGINVKIDFAFNMTTLPALQTYLNTLGYGTFVVTSTGPTSISITSTGNSTNIGGLFYSPSGTTDVDADMTKSSTGYIPLSANQVVQNIIDYICSLDDSQVSTSEEYEICYIDGDGVKQIETISEGQSLATVISALAERGCTTIDYIVALNSVNCTNIKAQFPQVTTEVMQSNDVFLGTKNGSCAGVYPIEAFLTMLTYGAYNADVLQAFCNMVNLCAAGNACDPYNVFFAELQIGSPSSDLVVTFENPGAVSNNIRYGRIDNTVSPIYTTVTGILPGASPYTIPVDAGQYRVYIQPVYADGRVCPETSVDTLPCSGILAFNATYDGSNINVTYTADESITDVQVELSYPNGGTFSQIYHIGDPIVIAPPENVFGTFFARIKPVCYLPTGYMGSASAPASFVIEETSP